MSSLQAPPIRRSFVHRSKALFGSDIFSVSPSATSQSNHRPSRASKSATPDSGPGVHHGPLFGGVCQLFADPPGAGGAEEVGDGALRQLEGAGDQLAHG